MQRGWHHFGIRALTFKHRFGIYLNSCCLKNNKKRRRKNHIKKKKKKGEEDSGILHFSAPYCPFCITLSIVWIPIELIFDLGC